MDRFAADNENSMEIPKWLHEGLFSNKYRVVRHILFWAFIYADELLSFIGVTEPIDAIGLQLIISVLADMAMVYINIYIFIPRFFLKGKVLLYLLLTALSVFAVVYIGYLIWIDPFSLFLDGSVLEEEPYTLSDLYGYFLGNFWPNAGIIGMAVAFKLFQESYRTSRKLQELREDQLNTELAYLKTQVNPHFLFNTLNNMYVMSKKKHENLPDTIMQLSDLLRYQLYETEEDTVPLSKEITYLNNYLELELLRRQHLKLEFNVTGMTNNKKIRPLILLPYIENAFKYSNSGTGSDFIRINLDAKESEIHFSIENTKGTLHHRDVGGIGLANAQRRLELAYPNKHELTISETDTSYIVNLIMQTS